MKTTLTQSSSIVENAAGEMTALDSILYVPESMRDQSGLPLTADPMTNSKYLSKFYHVSDLDYLQQLGVRTLSDTEFLSDLQALHKGNDSFIGKQPEEWHIRLTEALRNLSWDSPNEEIIRDLPLVPICDGTWVSASTKDIFCRMDETRQHIIPEDISLRLVDDNAQKNEKRNELFKKLKIPGLTAEKLQGKVMEKHSVKEPSRIPEGDTLLRHAICLFQTKWNNGNRFKPFWVKSQTGSCHRAREVYFDGPERCPSSPGFKELQHHFPILHASYTDPSMDDIKHKDRDRWTDWLSKEIGVRPASEITLRLQRMLIHKFSEPDFLKLPIREILISYLVYLFRSKWESKLTPRIPFWVASQTGNYYRANEVHFGDLKQCPPEVGFDEFRRKLHLLHEDYYCAVKPEEKDGWLAWLGNQVRVQPTSEITQKLQGLIVQKHTETDPLHLPAPDVAISHMAYLFRSSWTPEARSKEPPRFWVATHGGPFLPAKQVFINTLQQHSFGRYFDDFRQKFPFLHEGYYNAVEPEEMTAWLAWLRENVGVQDVEKLIPKLQDLTVRQCCESTRSEIPAREVLVSHTIFLFRTKWVSKSPRGDFWLVTESEECVPARQVYLKGTKQHPGSKYYDMFQKDLPFLHADYFLAINPNETNQLSSWLCTNLGVLGNQVLPKLQELIVKQCCQRVPSQIPAREILISHTVFLFQTKWTSKAPGGDFWLVTESEKCFPARQVYLEGTKRHPAEGTSHHHLNSEYYNKFRDQFPFLHPDYFLAIEPDEMGRWLSWLRNNLGVRDTKDLVPKLQELAVRQCCESTPPEIPARDMLISHAVFLFKTKWTSQTACSSFWLVTESEKCFPARQVYLDGTKGRSTESYSKFRKEFPFLHADYALAIEPDEMEQWLSWLRKNLGLCHVPQLLDPFDSATLSTDFQRILKEWQSRDFLVFLRDEWSSYANHLTPAEGPAGRTTVQHLRQDPGAALRDEIGKKMVKCCDGSLRQLRDTFTVQVFPSDTDETLLALQPLLDIPDPQEPAWGFLEFFGVTVKDNLGIYLRMLARVRGSSVPSKFIGWLYRSIQERRSEAPSLVR